MKKLITTALSFITWSFATFGQSGQQKPNFLVIFTDDQTYRAIGYNNSEVLTPNLDEWANMGLIFNNAFTSTPVCAASRASILTGLYPQTNGTVALDTQSFLQNIVKDKTYPTIADLLKNAGYTTYFSGKSHLGDPKDYGFTSGGEYNEFDDKKAFDEVSSFIKEPNFGKKPFFIWLAPRQPHVPLKPDQQWLDLYSKNNISLERNFLESPLKMSAFNQGLPGENFYRDSDYTNNYKNLPAGPPRSEKVIKEFSKAYYATITHLDFQIGELIKQFKAGGHLENTVVIFLSDNGYFLGNHGLGNKLTMHEESVRIPMFIYWDKLKANQARTDALVSSTDIFPTMLDLAGLPIPDHLHGKSLSPILKDPSAQINSFVASESVGVGGKVGTGHRMIRSMDWKYMITDVNEELLYNLSEDPFEKNNLINKRLYESEKLQLMEYYQEWKKLVGDTKPDPSSAK